MERASEWLGERGLQLPADWIKDAILCIDSHTAGEPTRVALAGVPVAPGRNVREKAAFLGENADHIRRTLTGEPRGHAATHAVVPVEPTSADADLGLIFMSPMGFHHMCGHALIGAVTTLLEVGVLESTEPVTDLLLETGAGMIEVRARVSEGRVMDVTFRNRPAFLYESLDVSVDSIGQIPVAVAYGGLWYVIVHADRVGLGLELENLDELRRVSLLIRSAVNECLVVRHPHLGTADRIPQLLFMGDAVDSQADGRNLVTSSELGFDRSPCGTGSCAKMALLYAVGELGLHEDYVHESIVGGLFRGRLVEEVTVGSLQAVIPEITGSAFVTSIHQVVVDPRDPLGHGFFTH